MGPDEEVEEELDEEDDLYQFEPFGRNQRYSRSMGRVWIQNHGKRIPKCWHCKQDTFVHVCLSRSCQQHHAAKWFSERGGYDQNGRRTRGGKSEVDRARQRWAINFPIYAL